MNIKKENIPVLVAPNAYVGTWNKHCIFSVYLEKNAFWKISHVGEDDMVIYTKDDNCKPYVLSGKEYQQVTIQHNNQLLAEMSPLDNEERKYLKAIVKPFRDKVGYLIKCQDGSFDEEYIAIKFKNTNDNCILLPNFKKGTMYKGMKEGVKYSIEELGL